MQNWLGEAVQDYDSLKIFGYHAYYRDKKDKLSDKKSFFGFKEVLKATKYET